MPWTLWRYTFVELWRVILICTVILVSVIAFAAAVKPLAEGALTPIGAIRFMLLAIPPMLAYAMPFAAGFGASLAYHRMAQDNETIAAYSGGVSHRGVLVPAIVTGLMLSAGMSALNEWMIPRFLRSMERMITLDVAQLMIRQIERGQPARLGDVMIAAERIDQIDPPPGSTARQVYLLHRVAAVQFDGRGEVVNDATVRQAWIVLAPDPSDESSTVCGIQFVDGVGYLGEGGLRQIDSARPRPIQIPDAFEDDPKFLTFPELLRLREDPDRMGFVDARRLRLAERLAMRELDALLRRELEGSGRVRLLGEGGRRFEVAADGARVASGGGAWLLSRGAGPVQVRRFEPDDTGALRVFTDTAEEAWIRLEQADGSPSDPVFGGGEASVSMRFTLQLLRVRTESAGGVPTERPQRDFSGLRVIDDPLIAHARRSSAELLSLADELEREGRSTAPVAAAAGELRRLIGKLQREITSKQQERLAMTAACCVMVVLGAVTALRHRDSLPLIVYLWSFFPALGMILLISSGQQQTHHGRSELFGIVIQWSGVAIATGLTLHAYARLARH
jgi:lipopolysaccharide export LptBFGC system permease protein LptF